MLLFFMCSCAGKKDNTIKYDFINTTFYVTNVSTAKYSKIEGYIIYKDILLHCDNDLSGYYYKKYNINRGDKIKVDVKIYQIPQGDDVVLKVKDVDFRKYEKRN